jgi:hypothetical protein
MTNRNEKGFVTTDQRAYDRGGLSIKLEGLIARGT